MKTLFFSILLILAASTSNAQEALGYTIRDNAYVIKPSLDNLVNLMFCDQTTFNLAMKTYNYKSSDNSTYYASNGAGKPYYSVTRNSDETIIYSELDGGFISSFRTELKSLSNELSPIYKDGYEHYYVSVTYDNIKRNIHIQMSSTSSGGSVIGIIKM